MIWDPFDPFSYFIHVIFGTIAFAAGIAALATKKGTDLHIKAGKVFSYLMILVAISTVVFMTNDFLPLAVVMTVAVLYLIPSAINSINHDKKMAALWDKLLTLIPLLLFVFTAMQFIRFLAIEEAPTVGPILLASTFGFILYQDLALLKNRYRERSYWIRRHMIRMILAFTFTAMAVIRLGINIGLTLEQTVVYPILFAWICIAYCYKKYSPAKLEAARA
ncbi:hypothetical protein AWR36_000340 [Microbulbifer flavimaris]|uniref:DUF2306 domain-containing protein n=1 Tax=Microbulbifer flavimaris TaxID=1781068 RepID=A0ABX4I2D9_9GAMM|nr:MULTISPECIES: hypothetical protein [Microbulbifer]KUJ84201.1 hypothetical protein AVO43_00340 [Microbulbifer sp. ZGT114]PCO06276.1 hypothetical protein AWR36_000340 [Microbulbifer flavimaris]